MTQRLHWVDRVIEGGWSFLVGLAVGGGMVWFMFGGLATAAATLGFIRGCLP